MRGIRLGLALGIVAFAAGAALAATQEADPPAQPQWSWPEGMENPQVFPADTPPERLRAAMIGFTRALGVRCQFCHIGEDGQDLSTFDFVSDANPNKNIARGMMRMTSMVNREALPSIEGLTQPRVGCYTCHRGSTIPAISAPVEE